jgi:hypothetical protein
MGRPSPQTHAKRLREHAKREKRRAKEARRAARKAAKDSEESVAATPTDDATESSTEAQAGLPDASIDSK